MTITKERNESPWLIINAHEVPYAVNKSGCGEFAM